MASQESLASFLALEQAAFSAWPAAEHHQFKDVIVFCSQGYTKRANSANVMHIAAADYAQQVRDIESFYRERKQPCIFRLPSFAVSQDSALAAADINTQGIQEPQSFDDYLAQQGYVFRDKSLVLVKSLNDASSINNVDSSNNADHIQIAKYPLDQWLQCFHQLQEKTLDLSQSKRNESLHLAILKRIKDIVIPLVLLVDDQPVACVLGVLKHDKLGIFDLYCYADFRGKKHAKRLVLSLLHEAVALGATHSYLQVVADNHAARKLYNTLGFSESYHYWYRIKPLAPQS